MGCREGIARRLLSKEEELEGEEGLREGIVQIRDKNVYQSSKLGPKTTHSNTSRRRKGIPHRAPLGH